MKVALNEISQSSIFVTAGNCLICLFILFTICGDVLVYTAFYSPFQLRKRKISDSLFLFQCYCLFTLFRVNFILQSLYLMVSYISFSFLWIFRSFIYTMSVFFFLYSINYCNVNRLYNLQINKTFFL